MTTAHVEAWDPSVRDILAAAGYRGRKAVTIRATRSVELSGTYWSGGSRRTFTAVALTDPPRAKELPRHNPPQFGGPRDAPVAILTPEVCIVETGDFCGRSTAPTIHVHPDSLASLLPAPMAVSEDVATVCAYTASLKNSHGGRTDIRFNEARRDRGITRERWDAAKASAIEAKLLTKSGAITAAGRDVASRDRGRD